MKINIFLKVFFKYLLLLVSIIIVLSIISAVFIKFWWYREISNNKSQIIEKQVDYERIN
jgi:hypothetical protein